MTKQELKRYVRMNIELKQLEEQIERLEAQITSPKIPVLSGMPKGGKRVDIADKIAKLADLKQLYTKRWDKLIDERLRIEKAIDALDDPVERALMRYKYIDGLTWEEVCVKINYEWAQMHRIHAKTLIKLKMI